MLSLRLTFVALPVTCGLLFLNDRVDYAIVLLFFMLMAALYTPSVAHQHNDGITIMKYYFWRLMRWTLNVSNDQLVSIRSQKWNVVDNAAVWGDHDSVPMFSINRDNGYIASQFITAIITYQSGGTKRDVRVDIELDIYRSVEKMISRKGTSPY